MRIESRAPAEVPDFRRPVHCLLGLPIDAVDFGGAVHRIQAAVALRERCFLSTPNVNFLVGSRADEAFRDSVVHSDLSIADGMPLVWLAKLMHIPIRQRIAGASLFDALRDAPRDGSGGRLAVFFFGGSKEAGEAAWRRLCAENAGVICVGHECPGFGSVEDMSTDALLRRINAAKPDLLLVSLGARKGQAWIERNRPRLEVPVVAHLGAVLNFVAGTVRRAPPRVQALGLEWLWRIKEEPRLWRRYFHDAAAFAGLVAIHALPYAWHVRHHRPSADALARASVQVSEDGERCRLRLRGAWTERNLAQVREVFRAAALAGRDVELDMSGVSYIDSAFVGLLMLLRGHLQRCGRRLRLAPAPRRVRRVLDLCGVRYLHSVP